MSTFLPCGVIYTMLFNACSSPCSGCKINTSRYSNHLRAFLPLDPSLVLLTLYPVCWKVLTSLEKNLSLVQGSYFELSHQLTQIIHLYSLRKFLPFVFLFTKLVLLYKTQLSFYSFIKNRMF